MLAEDAMTDEELKRIESRGYGVNGLPSEDLAALIADNLRLRALVKEAECNGRHESEPADICPWCSFVRGLNGVEFKNTHSADCPAFTPDGAVK